MCDYAYCAQDPNWWEESYQVLWGCHSICHPLTQFQVTQVTQSELSTLSHNEVWGGTKKFWRDLAFLLILPKRTIKGEMAFGLAMVWAHPYQAQVSSLDEVAKKLTLLTTSSGNWAYAFVQFNKDAQHVPLPMEGHLSTMINGALSRNAWWCLCQLEVHQLLQWEDQVVYPEGLNGGPEASSNLSTRITSPQHEYVQWIYIPTSGPLPGHARRPVAQGLSPLQNLDTNFPHSSHHGTFP